MGFWDLQSSDRQVEVNGVVSWKWASRSLSLSLSVCNEIWKFSFVALVTLRRAQLIQSIRDYFLGMCWYRICGGIDFSHALAVMLWDWLFLTIGLSHTVGDVAEKRKID